MLLLYQLKGYVKKQVVKKLIPYKIQTSEILILKAIKTQFVYALAIFNNIKISDEIYEMYQLNQYRLSFILILTTVG